MRSREEEAGRLYVDGANAVSAGGDDLGLLAGHLIIMIRGTQDHKGPLWPVRLVPPDNREIKLDRFIDYLRKQMREGLNIPSLYFLQQVLKASGDIGQEALGLVRKELAKENIDFDAVADQERDTALLKRELKATGRPPATEKGVPSTPLPKGNSKERRAAQLAQRRPDLADLVRAGKMKLSKALIESGIRKKQIKRCPKCGHEW